jgi:hypothetical protein
VTLIRLLVFSFLLIITASTPGIAAEPITIDSFEDVTGWSPHPADGVELKIGSGDGAAGKSLQLDFKFTGGGYAVARKAFDFDVPGNYAFSFRVRGESLPNTLEFKLIDSTGENVWWAVRRDMAFSKDWETITFRKRHISFAWGPIGGGELKHVAAIEFAVTAGSGGTGTVWIDELELRELPPPGATPPAPVATATSELPGSEASGAVDRHNTRSWASAPGDARPAITLNFQESVEFGGLTINWNPGKHRPDYDVQISNDGKTWRVVRPVRGSNGGPDYIFLPETEARQLRLVSVSDGAQVGIIEIIIHPIEWSATRESFFEYIAKNARRGLYPRSMLGEQTYWTVVGVDGDTKECLFGEDGAIEVGKGMFSIEPFLTVDGRLVTWADVEMTHELSAGADPAVKWTLGDLDLRIRAGAFGLPDSSFVEMSYSVFNRGADPKTITLHLAVRPFQVNPPFQFLNTRGGTAPIRQITFENRALAVDGEPRLRLRSPGETDVTFGSVTFDQGDAVADYLALGRPLPGAAPSDSFSAASAVLSIPVELAPRSARAMSVTLPLYLNSPASPGNFESLSRVRAVTHLNDAIALPAASPNATSGSGAELMETLRAQLSYILINRAGPAIQPGVRSYARSWIRDGALTSSALLRMGQPEPVHEFIAWFAPHQYANGKIPCVVDHRGADPVPEHDSSGEFIFLIAEYHRFMRDPDHLAKYWPQVVRAADYLDSLRLERRTPEYQKPETKHFYGILPPSISHEGYSAKPMHSYWDDFFALKGFRDAVWLAEEMRDEDTRRRLVAIRDEFERDFVNSINASMAFHKIDYIPGCADLGDFDATSTSIALAPVGAENVVPEAALRRTFDKYYEFITDRTAQNTWDAYTPYEARNIGAFIRLGQPDRAWELTQFLLSHQRPRGWRVWAEVVGREERKPRFIGDMPHTWVGSDFVRSVLDMFVYEDNGDSTLVVGAGIRSEWVTTEPGVAVNGLPTPYGALRYTIKSFEGGTEVKIEDGVRMPAGGVVVALPPSVGDSRRATVNGVPAGYDKARKILVRSLPAAIVIPKE